MPATMPTTAFDARFSQPDASASPWPDVSATLESAELYWLTTVRADGRPHVTPLVGVWVDGAFTFCTGAGEQKALNLRHQPNVAVTTGSNTWQEGTDIVIEGTAVQVTDHETLVSLAQAYLDKYGEAWRFEPGDHDFGTPDAPVPVYRVTPTKVLAFAKAPHGQTRYRFAPK
jgi:general stress protein 26